MKVEWSKEARNNLAKLDKKERDRVVTRVLRFVENLHGNIRRVRISRDLALRVGDWRVFFDPPEGDVIRFTAVRRRDKAYKK